MPIISARGTWHIRLFRGSFFIIMYVTARHEAVCFIICFTARLILDCFVVVPPLCTEIIGILDNDVVLRYLSRLRHVRGIWYIPIVSGKLLYPLQQCRIILHTKKNHRIYLWFCCKRKVLSFTFSGWVEVHLNLPSP